MSGALQRLFGASNRIDHRLADCLSPCRARDFVTFSKELPSYRYVDLYNASEFCTSDWRRVNLESQHPNVDLTSLLTGEFYNSLQLQIRRSEQKAWPVGPEDDRFLPVDMFWIQSGPGSTKTVVRLSDNEYISKSKIEVASNNADVAEACLKAIVARSESHSVMKGAVLRLSFEAGTRDEFGDVEKPESLRIGCCILKPSPIRTAVISACD